MIDVLQGEVTTATSTTPSTPSSPFLSQSNHSPSETSTDNSDAPMYLECTPEYNLIQTPQPNPTARTNTNDIRLNVAASLKPPALTPLLRESRVEIRMRTMRSQLHKLQGELTRQSKAKKSTVNLRDQTDIQALLDYSALVSQMAAEGQSAPETTASLQIASTKISSTSIEGNIVSKGAWYARTLRRKGKHVLEWGVLPERRQGKGAVHASLIDDKRVQEGIKQYIMSLEVGKVSFFRGS